MIITTNNVAVTCCYFLFTIMSLIKYMFPFNSTRISNELGAGSPKNAHLAVKVLLLMAFTAGIIESAFFMAVWKVWPRAFTNVHEVATYLTSLTPIVATSVFVDSIQTALQGTK